MMQEIHKTKEPLNKKEFEKIIEKVIKFDSFYVGQGAKDLFLYIFGVPIVALFAKRIVPGPIRTISDDLFIPAVTSGTVYYLAKTNKLWMAIVKKKKIEYNVRTSNII